MIQDLPTTASIPPVAHFNHSSYYYPYDITTETVTDDEGNESVVYKYMLLIVPEADYENIRQGNLCGTTEWTDALRSIERSAFYDLADMYISKYSTDEADEEKKQAWIDFKAEVRLTTTASDYPASVTYPAPPF